MQWPLSYFVLAALFQANHGASATGQHPLLSVPPEQWQGLNDQVDGRLFGGVPFARPCFSSPSGPGAGNASACVSVQTNYLDEVSRTNSPGAFINTQWETCQATGEQCLLDFTDPANSQATNPPNQCQLGSVPNYFIDVQKPEDVATAFLFSKKTAVPLIIKNTGHDYKGRSSAPDSLSLWTHNLKNISYDTEFVPEGCSSTNHSTAVTVGAGVQWGEVYSFAEAHNITVVGGSDLAVGVSGGWTMGGGHGALSNTMGLGVDRVLEYKLVTPDGVYRTANACQNQDLFFALRGGGGGTFGVVLESTILASPQVTLQVVVVAFGPNAALARSLWSILINNSLTWAEDGWGGFATTETAIYINPKLGKADAAKSMAPLIAFGQQIQSQNVTGAQLIVTEFPSWGTFFNFFVSAHVAAVGSSVALASRLINKSNFQTSDSRSELLSGLLSAEAAAPGLIILVSPPASFEGDGQTSVTDLWRESIFHVTVVSEWNWNATVQEKKGNYTRVSTAIDHLRAITPDGAYLNEADVHEPNHEVAFWGDHYPKLLSIKQKYDPDHLLDCWQCVGWNPDSPRFSCYI